MKEKIIKAIKDPGYALHILLYRYGKLSFRKKIFHHSEEYRSISENGDDLGSVAEIGCGYGGQALVNDQLLEVKHTTLFDLPFVNKLIERYLDTYLLNGAYKVTTINKEVCRDYDLVISNYAFSELPKKLQLKYIDKLLAKSSRGYLTMNSGLVDSCSAGKLSIDELRDILPQFEVFEENPLTSPYNYIIAWGYDSIFSNKMMKIKNV